MYKFVVCFIIFYCTVPVFATTYSTNNGFSQYRSPNYTTTTLRPYSTYRPNYYNSRKYRNIPPSARQYYYNNPYYRRNPNISVSNLNSLEKYALNKIYSKESDLSRLERLESLAFGAVQSGDIASRYQNVENAILSRPPQNAYKKSILGNLSSYLTGQATGITPSIITQDPGFPGYTSFGGFSTAPSSYYPNQRIEQFNNGIFGNGYSILNQNYGSGSSVKILD